MAERRADGARRVERQPRGRAQERHEQDVRVRQARGRIARHAEERHAVDAARMRSACPASPRCRERSSSPRARDEIDDQIAVADRAAAGEDDQVGAGAGVERARRARRACPAPARCGSAMPPCAATTARQREAVDVVDLARRRAVCPARRLRCRWTESATRGRANTSSSAQPMAATAPTRLGFSRSPRRDRRRRRARCRRRAARCSGPRRPRQRRRRASSPAATVSSTMTTASAPSGSGAPVAISAHVPGAIALRRQLAGVDALDDAQAHRAIAAWRRGVGGDHRVAVHRRPRERRNGRLAPDIGRRDAPGRVASGTRSSAVDRAHVRSDEPAGALPRARWWM